MLIFVFIIKIIYHWPNRSHTYETKDTLKYSTLIGLWIIQKRIQQKKNNQRSQATEEKDDRSEILISNVAGAFFLFYFILNFPYGDGGEHIFRVLYTIALVSLPCSFMFGPGNCFFFAFHRWKKKIKLKPTKHRYENIEKCRQQSNCNWIYKKEEV